MRKLGATLKLRRARPGDAAALRRMLRALMTHGGHPSSRPISAAELARHMGGRRPDIEAVIAERAGRAVGMVLFFPWLSTWRGRLNLYIQDLYIEPAERGSGLGRRLLAVETSNETAEQFYRRLGFGCLETERHWLLPPEGVRALLRRRGPGRGAARGNDS